MAGIQELLVQCPGCGLIRPLNQRGATQFCINCDYPIPTAGLDAPQAQSAVRQAQQMKALLERVEEIGRSSRNVVRLLIALLVVTVLAALLGCGPDAAGPPPVPVPPAEPEVSDATAEASPIVRVDPQQKPIPEVLDLPGIDLGMLEDALAGEGPTSHSSDSWSLTLPNGAGTVTATVRGRRIFEIQVALVTVEQTDEQIITQSVIVTKVLNAVLPDSQEDLNTAQHWFARALRTKREDSAEFAGRDFARIRLEAQTFNEIGVIYLFVRPNPHRIAW